MIPWTLLGKAQTPGNGLELSLYRRDTEFSIRAGTYELMNSRAYGSEDALATLALEKIRDHTRPRVLVGGLGMGYTLRAALDGLKTNAQVAVAELLPEVVEWNREFLSDLAGRPLDDDRVAVYEDDVADMIKTAKGEYSAILLDVDNGPQALIREGNNWLYSSEGLMAAFAALRPKGVLAIWASEHESAFARRFSRAGFEVDEVRVRARSQKKGGAHYIVWVGLRG